MNIKKQFGILLAFLLVVLLFSGCGYVDTSWEGKADYYVIAETNSKIFHDPSCSYIPSGKSLTKKEYKSAFNSGYTPCSHCEPDYIYERDLYVDSEHSLNEKMDNFVRGELHDWDIVFPDYDDYGSVVSYVAAGWIGSIFWTALRWTDITIILGAVVTIRLLIICAVIVPIVLLIRWIVKKVKGNSRY